MPRTKAVRVKQYPYLSPEALGLRKRDGIPPWGFHPCEVDDCRPEPGEDVNLHWQTAANLRDEIEARS